ncbi:hypothetical protein GCM10009837_10210 [Streptomyces durmitorensis]|uniref:Cytochrome P450 n=1 Tax=Streptomyces durmitorensis TaxID=319947 RepID=A0ABY4PKB0_9ACTN|nr:cytochrome P450 [Streptomyces durmitorensis]UQT54121.1 cytochrome P450 [Streptomyces durmitorensis]
MREGVLYSRSPRHWQRIFGFSEQAALQLVTALPALLDGGDKALEANQQIMNVIEESDARSAEEIVRSNEEIPEQAWLTLASAMGAMGNWISNGLERQVNSAKMRNDVNHGLADIEGAMRATLWEQPPLQRVIGRWATRDTRLGEQDIAAGDLLVLDLAAVNQDPCMGSDAERAAMAAHSEANLRYGAGEHECPFPDLAEAITVTAIDCLLQRLPDVRLADGASLTWRPSVIVRALEALPVRFAPTARSVPASEVPSRV